MAKYPVLYRKRLDPQECVELKNDVILRCDSEVIVTSWRALHPRSDLCRGYSCYYRSLGFKVSAFIDHHDRLLYWYCDIVNYSGDSDRLLVTDLLADVLIYPDGKYRVVDLNELAGAMQNGLLGTSLVSEGLCSLDRLLGIIYDGKFTALTCPILDLAAGDPAL